MTSTTVTALPVPAPRTAPLTPCATGPVARSTGAAPNPPAVHLPAPVLDNRPVYLAWAAAYAVGHGATALAGGDDPVVAMPGWLPAGLLAVSMVAAMALTVVRATRDKKAMRGDARRTAALLGNTWVIGFTGLAALITGTAFTADDQHLQTLLWPTGSALVVGILYTAAGAAYRDSVQYTLGAYLAVLGAAAVTLGEVGSTALLATAGVAGYLAAAALEPARVADARDAATSPTR